MGAMPWSYFVPFESSVGAALQKLRQHIFKTGEFRGSELKPATPEEAVENMEADGTASILDIVQVSESPDFCSVCPLPTVQLETLFGTAQPTREMIESNMDFYDDIERGQGIYIVVYKFNKPEEYFFAGYSFD
ncbi:MAG TPA: hypothetical protein VFE58_05415 [Tepidisphaeraceae bacterium]|jgi:hypothetical protein|nr:hypothetical protein [Tepidisphaeraceae bacterium]